MKTRVLKWAAGAVVAAIGLAGAADLVSAGFLRRRSERYQRELAEIRQRSASYQRVVISGERLEQNAAVWYRQALPRFRGKPSAELAQAVKDGYAHYRDASSLLFDDQCRETRSARVRQALRCTRCNWEADAASGVGIEFEYGLEAVTLGDCLIVSGHRAAREQQLQSAVDSYLEAVASDIWRDVSRFEDRLPDGRLAVRRYKLWLENVLQRESARKDGLDDRDQSARMAMTSIELRSIYRLRDGRRRTGVQAHHTVSDDRRFPAELSAESTSPVRTSCFFQRRSWAAWAAAAGSSTN